MRRLVVLAASARLAFATVSAEAAVPSFRHGVAAGEPTSTSAVLWTRAPRPGTVFLGQDGAGTAIGALFFKPQPPNGLGMRCAALDTYSYAQVTVTARRLTVALKDASGRPVREATGVECSPLVLTAR